MKDSTYRDDPGHAVGLVQLAVSIPVVRMATEFLVVEHVDLEGEKVSRYYGVLKNTRLSRCTSKSSADRRSTVWAFVRRKFFLSKS